MSVVSKKGEMRMSQCFRMTFVINNQSKDAFAEIIKKEAHKLDIEGVAQIVGQGHLRVVACGIKESIEQFLDLLYKEMALQECNNLEVETFLKDKDYRGIFRVIE